MPLIYDRITEHSERIVEDLGDLEAPLVQQMHAGRKRATLAQAVAALGPSVIGELTVRPR